MPQFVLGLNEDVHHRLVVSEVEIPLRFPAERVGDNLERLNQFE